LTTLTIRDRFRNRCEVPGLHGAVSIFNDRAARCDRPLRPRAPRRGRPSGAIVTANGLRESLFPLQDINFFVDYDAGVPAGDRSFCGSLQRSTTAEATKRQCVRRECRGERWASALGWVQDQPADAGGSPRDDSRDRGGSLPDSSCRPTARNATCQLECIRPVATVRLHGPTNSLHIAPETAGLVLGTVLIYWQNRRDYPDLVSK